MKIKYHRKIKQMLLKVGKHDVNTAIMVWSILCYLSSMKKQMFMYMQCIFFHSTFDLFWFLSKTFYPKFELPNSGCGSSASVAYPQVFN